MRGGQHIGASGWQIDRASAAYFCAVADELERLDRNLLPPQRPRPRMLDSAHLPAQQSRRVFDHAYLQGGCAVLLRAGRGLQRAAFDPASYLLDQARSVGAMICLWQALQDYYHSHLRIEVLARDECELRLRHHSLRPSYRLSIAETLIIAGVIIACLERLGCSAIRCRIGRDPQQAAQVYEDGHCLEGLLSVEGGAANLILLSWAGRADDADDGASPSADILRMEARTDCTVRRVMFELARDLERNWSVDEIARRAGTSSRTLQRVLQRCGLSFKCALAAARLRAACHMLSRTHVPITQIALACGYTDSAHFCRQFRRAAGMTPSAYRRIGHECRGAALSG